MAKFPYFVVTEGFKLVSTNEMVPLVDISFVGQRTASLGGGTITVSPTLKDVKGGTSIILPTVDLDWIKENLDPDAVTTVGWELNGDTYDYGDEFQVPTDVIEDYQFELTWAE